MTRRKQDSTEAARAVDPVTATGGSRTSRSADESPVTSPHAKHFAFLTGSLVAVALLAIVVAGMIADHDNQPESISLDLSWSQYQPQDKDPDAGSRDIADHVGREYKLANGKQMVAVTGGAMELGGLPMNLALREPVSDGGGIDLLPGDGVLYRMCGLGPGCSLDQGKPSVARELLLRRQALELALYSFKYLKKTDNVVVFMPAARSQSGEVSKDKTALFFTKPELKAQLKQPLDKTLPGATPPTPSTMVKSPNSLQIDQFTNAHRFSYSLTQANSEQSVFLVMDPISEEPATRGSGPGANTSPSAGGTSGSGGSTGAGQSQSGSPSNGAPQIEQPLSPTAPGSGG